MYVGTLLVVTPCSSTPLNKNTSSFVLGALAGAIIAIFVIAVVSRDFLHRSGGAQEVRVIKFAHGLPSSHPVHKGIELMATRLDELSGGTMRIEIFPGEQMGDETRTLEQTQLGTIEMVKISAAPLGNFVTACKVFSLPYLFRDSDHYWRVLDGEVGKQMLEEISVRDDGKSSGLVGVGFFDAGSRNFYALSPINGVEDLKGKKIRLMRDPVAMDMVSAFGASPAAIPWGELYSALQQGVVDGAENNPPSIVSARHGEVCKYLTMDHHSRIPDIVLAGAKFWDSLNDTQKGWLMQAMQEASVYQRELWARSSEESLEQLRSEGVTVIEPDLAPFRAATMPVVEKYSTGKVGDYYKAIQEVK